MKGNNSKAEEQFKSSISIASTNGFLQDRGLIHELASKYYAAKGDNYWSEYHKEKAESSFSAWGATAKVEEMQKMGLTHSSTASLRNIGVLVGNDGAPMQPDAREVEE